MRALFRAIRHNDIHLVKDLIGNKPELIHCTAKQPPKKDDGQSPLQIALKTGIFDIAEYLLDMGADPNFMEAEDCCYPEQRAPALHDAINAAVVVRPDNKLTVFQCFRKGVVKMLLDSSALNSGETCWADN